MRNWVFAVWMILVVGAPKAGAAVPEPSIAAVSVSTKSVTALRPAVSSIYTGERYRDPFLAPGSAGGGGVAPVATFNPEEFSIHDLLLKGILKGKAGDYAIFAGAGSGASFLLEGGKLLDASGKPIPGVSGMVRAAQKSVQLTTKDGDVQILKLGEEEEE